MMEFAAQDNEVLAHHEAGRAVVGQALNRLSLGIVLQGTDGVTMFRPRDTEPYHRGDTEARVDAQILVRGDAAEPAYRQLHGSRSDTYGSGHDRKTVEEITFVLYPDADEFVYAEQWKKEMLQVADIVIAKHGNKLEQLAESLLVQRSLGKGEIAAILASSYADSP